MLHVVGHESVLPQEHIIFDSYRPFEVSFQDRERTIHIEDFVHWRLTNNNFLFSITLERRSGAILGLELTLCPRRFSKDQAIDLHAVNRIHGLPICDVSHWKTENDSGIVSRMSRDRYWDEDRVFSVNLHKDQFQVYWLDSPINLVFEIGRLAIGTAQDGVICLIQLSQLTSAEIKNLSISFV